MSTSFFEKEEMSTWNDMRANYLICLFMQRFCLRSVLSSLPSLYLILCLQMLLDVVSIYNKVTDLTDKKQAVKISIDKVQVCFASTLALCILVDHGKICIA